MLFAHTATALLADPVSGTLDNYGPIGNEFIASPWSALAATPNVLPCHDRANQTPMLTPY
jgi:hypothetical protein